MTDRNFTTRFTVDQNPDAVVAAINNVRGWWSEGITGHADKVGDRFTHSVLDLHRCDLMVTEMVPGKKVAWTVLDNHFSFTRDSTEWKGTDIVFEIERTDDGTEVRFTHVGLVPDYECYDICRDGWTTYIASLRDLIATGKGEPNIGEAKTGSEVALVEAQAAG
jgi:hypothetical protein